MGILDKIKGLLSGRKNEISKGVDTAAKFAKASSSLAKVERELKELEGKTAATRTRLSGLEDEVKLVAINSYVRGNVNEAFVFDKDLGRTSRRNAMARFVTVERRVVDTAAQGRVVGTRNRRVAHTQEHRAVKGWVRGDVF